MQIIRNTRDLRSLANGWRKESLSTGFVPTMGNLHAGHLKLVDESIARTDRTVVSIFVNPMQFSASEDYKTYPKTLDEDCALLTEKNVDILFAPTVEEVYPNGLEQITRINIPGLADRVEGTSRPGHFAGVATVVAKLLNMVQPDIALFGEKDFQQLLVIRQMVADLNMPVQIIGISTVREGDGLAMSSRNGYLSDYERQIAPEIFNTLQSMQDQIMRGKKNLEALENQAIKDLVKYKYKVDYLTIRRASDLLPPASNDQNLVILAAAWLGKTRLIDNLSVTIEG